MKILYLLLLTVLIPINSFAQGIPNCPNATIIGKTSFETQGIDGSSGRLIYEWPDYTMAAVWMIGSNYPSFPDRGTGYNYFNGSAWNAIPIGRIEPIKTGYPNIIGGSLSEEFIFCHRSQNSYQLFRNIHGSGPWIETDLPIMPVIWNRFARGGPNSQTIHLIGSYQFPASGQFYPMTYWRSPDNGITWDIQDFTIPQLDSSNLLMNSPGKNIACRGNVVAIVTGGFTDDLILCKSIDNGLTWTKTIINQFPIPFYDDQTMVTDVNNDGVIDTIKTVDYCNTLVIDNNNTVHVWAGENLISDPDTMTMLGYFPRLGNLLYWNENMPPNTILNNVIAGLEDLNNDGNTENIKIKTVFNCTAVSMATAGINAWNHLFVAYSALLEDTINPWPPPVSTGRNVYIMKSTDNGVTWTTPARVCPEAGVNQLFPSMSEFVYDDPRIVFFRDTSNELVFPPHLMDVVFISPDISTSLPAINGDPFQFDAWQSENNNEIVIEFKSMSETGNAMFEMHDLTGRLLKSIPISINSNSRSHVINIGSAATGIYVAGITLLGATKYKKLFFENRE